MSKLIVVIGVTGAQVIPAMPSRSQRINSSQGSSVAKTFLNLPGWVVRGVSRNPSSAASQALSTLGVEIVKGDLDDKASLLPAFEGAHTIFANTDFFTHFFSAIGSPEITSGRDPKIYGHDREIEQGLNIAEVAASPTVINTLERFIYSSLADATKWSGGKYKTVYHFDCKAEVIRVIWEKYPELAKRMSELQMGHYVSNWKTFPPMAPQKLQDRSYVMRRPTAADVQWPFVVTEQDTGEFVKALVDLPVGTVLSGFSEVCRWLPFYNIEYGFLFVVIQHDNMWTDTERRLTRRPDHDDAAIHGDMGQG